jgi:outer membrane protein assembly factor BamB
MRAIFQHVTKLMYVLAASSAACAHPPDAPRGGGSGGGGINAADLLIWRADQVSAAARPVLDDHAVYFQSIDHVASAVDKLTGKLLWKVQLPVAGDRHGTGLALVAGHLIVGDRDVFALDPSTGAVLWRFQPTVGAIPGFQRLSVDAATVYCGSGSGNVYAIDAASGAQRWAAAVVADTAALVYNPIVSGGVVFVAYSSFRSPPLPGIGGVAAVDAATGRVLWTRLVPQPDPSLPTYNPDGVGVTADRVLVSSADGWLYALDRATGATSASIPRSIFETAPHAANSLEARTIAVSGSVVLVGSTTATTVTALAATDLHRLWIQSSVPVSPAIDSSATLGLGSPSDIVLDGELGYVVGAATTFGVLQLSDGKLLWSIKRHTLRTDGLEQFLQGPGVDLDRIYLGGVVESYALKKR